MSFIPFLERGIWCVLDLNILELSLFGEIYADSNRIKRFHPKEECTVDTNFWNLVNYEKYHAANKWPSNIELSVWDHLISITVLNQPTEHDNQTIVEWYKYQVVYDKSYQSESFLF